MGDANELLMAAREVTSAVGGIATLVSRMRPEAAERVQSAFLRVAQAEFAASDALRAGEFHDVSLVAAALDSASAALAEVKDVLTSAQNEATNPRADTARPTLRE